MMKFRRRRSVRDERGFSVLGFLAFVIAFGLLALFGYRVWFYASKIRSGEIVDLPQYNASFTSSGENVSLSSTVVERAAVETADNPELGLGTNDNPSLTIVEFADFECPFSQSEHATVRRLMAKYGDKVRFIYRDYPLESIHPHAFTAALAAECAREQRLFWAYHDKLFANADALERNDLLKYALEVGADVPQFTACLDEERYADAVTRDIAAAKSFGVRGTPTFFLNGQRVEGAVPEDVLNAVVDEMLKRL